jgi:hypothetical protein
MKKIIILFIASAIAFSTIHAEHRSFQERTENWLQQPVNTSNPTEPSRIGTPTNDPEVSSSIGEGWLILTALAGGLSLVKRRKRDNSN